MRSCASAVATSAERKPLTEKYPDLHAKIQSLIDKDTYGNPENPLVWTTWSVRKIAEQLLACFGYDIHFTSIGKELDAMGYSRQQNQKMCQIGDQHPDRDAQFRYINETAQQFLDAGDPVISIDTKKKENIGNFKNNGSEYRPKGEPRRVLDHDFPLPKLGKVVPYGVYVLNNNTGFSSITFRIYPMKPGLKFMYPIFHRERPSGIKSSTGYFAIYPRTGKASH